MARNKRCRRNNYSDGGTALIVVGVIVVILALVFLLGGKGGEITLTEQQPSADVQADIPAEVNAAGDCIGREGIEMGLCCATWNPTTEMEEWVPCEDLEKQEAGLQAFFTFGEGSTLESVSSIMFAVRLTNEGNAAAGVKISSVAVNATQGGDAASVSEIKRGFESLITSFRTVAPGTYTEFNMNWVNRIRLDIPSGTEAFTMKDGTYSVTLNIQIQDSDGTIMDGGSRTVTMQVEQENIQFSIDVQTV